MANPHTQSITPGSREVQAEDHFGKDTSYTGLDVVQLVAHAIPGTIIADNAQSDVTATGIAVAGMITAMMMPKFLPNLTSPWLRVWLHKFSLIGLGAGYWLTKMSGNTRSVSGLVGFAVWAFTTMPLMPRATDEMRLPRVFFANDPGGRLRRSNPYWGTR